MAISTAPIFNAEKHTYTDPAENFQYCSVTRWVEKFKYPFNEQDTAKRIAKREGIPVEVVLETWAKKRNDSADFGTKLHKALEVFCSTEKILYPEFKEILQSFRTLNVLLDKKTCMFEKLVYDRKLKIAGTSDVIIHNKDKKTFNVYDFKSNKKFRYTSPFGYNMIDPLTAYPCAEFFTYSLQLSMYAYLYRLMTGLEPLRLKIFWYERFLPEDYTKTEGRWHIVNIPFLEEEIIKCLNYEK